MKLPALPYRGEKTKRQITAFRGLDLTQEAEDGALRDSYGLSTGMWPCLSPRQRREVLDSYREPTDLFSWDGKLVVVDGAQLYYDGVAVGNVLPGKKQFAVVNTKLCIWPDKTYIDLASGTYGRLDPYLETVGISGSVTMDDDSLKAVLSPTKTNKYTYLYRKDLTIYTYGRDSKALEDCFVDGAWDMEKLEQLKKLKGIASATEDGILYEGDIFIPQKVKDGGWDSYEPVTGDAAEGGALPDVSLYNDEGRYAKLTSKYKTSNYIYLEYDMSVVGKETESFSSVFHVGDAVNITGTPFGISDAQHAIITRIDDSTNTLSFARNTFPICPIYSAVIPEGGLLIGRKYEIKIKDQNLGYSFYPNERFQAGDVLFVTGTREDEETVYLWSVEQKKVIAQFSSKSISNYFSSDALIANEYLGDSVLTIRRDVPDLDFICSNNNRLWGVSNRQSNTIYSENTKKLESCNGRVIYASALGDPSNFWSFDGLSTDSYQVAVGSEGDFTAICAYGDSILCWKENMLHKILGSSPAQFYMNDYHFAGVRSGAHRSLQLINQTLFYLGRDGVYAYSGGMPSNLSRKLGVLSLTNAAGETDGQRYLISGTDPSGAGTLLSYDLARGVWLREDRCAADALALVGQDRYLLTHNKIYRYNDALCSERVPWMAELAPFYEDPFTKSGYTRLVLSLEMSKGSWITAEVCEDCGPWRRVWTQRAANRMTFCAPLHIGRCDRFSLRLSGEGHVVIRAILREFTQGGSYGAEH